MRKTIVIYFLFLVSFFIFWSSGTIDSSDGLQYLTVARNIYYRGEPILFDNPQEEYRDVNPQNIHFNYTEGNNKRFYSVTGLGYSLAYLPAVFITDIYYQLNHLPIILKHFPLQSDWLIMTLASFTNSIFGAGLGVTLFLYLSLLGLSKKSALLVSFLGLVSTNLFVYTKHAFPHLMFSNFLLLSFYFLKRYSLSRKTTELFFSGISYGLVIIAYNQTFILPVIPWLIYYGLLVKQKRLTDLLAFAIGVIPFYGLYYYYEFLKQSNFHSVLTTTVKYGQIYLNNHFSKKVFLEGIYGQLLSSGRGFFWYSPLLLLIGIFWHKFSKKIWPEILVFGSLLIIYVIFYARQIELYLGENSLWHGEFSWGPRYLTPLIPLGILLVGWLYQQFNRSIKLLVVLPLVLFGLYFNLVENGYR
jgi:hypothetical protein